MRLFNRKSHLQRALDSLEVPSRVKSGLPGKVPGKAVKTSLIAAGGLAGLTAASAGISSLRRRSDG